MMKNRWQTKRLGDVCRFIDYRGKTPEKTTRGLRLITAKNVKMGYLQETPMEFVSPKSYDGWMTRGIPKVGDVLFTTEAPLANVAQLDTEEKVVFAQRIIVLQPSEDDLDRTFLKYLLLSDVAQRRIHEKGTGATVKGIKASLLKDIPIEFPPLPEQQRIVGILDEAFEGIATTKANAEKNLQNARALFESHLHSIFTHRGKEWEEKRLGAVCDLQNGYAFKSGDYIESSNTLNIRMSSIRPGGYFDPEHNQRFLPDAYAKEYESFLLKEGDLIIAMTDMAGDPKILGVPTLVRNRNGRSFLMNQRVGKLFGFSVNVRVPYLRYFLTSPLIKQFYKSRGAGGLQINISKADILSAQIPLPRTTVQDNMVAQLDAVSEETQSLESIYQQKLAALEALKKSLLHQAFTGQLIMDN